MASVHFVSLSIPENCYSLYLFGWASFIVTTFLVFETVARKLYSINRVDCCANIGATSEYRSAYEQVRESTHADGAACLSKP